VAADTEDTEPAGAPTGATLSRRGGSRLLYLDNLKIMLISAVIVAHAGMTYGAAGSWVYEEPSLSDPVQVVLDALIVVGVLFGLGLFFLMAGMLTPGPLQRQGPRRFLLSRTWRLGPPVVAYAVVVWPVLRWISERAQGYEGSLWRFYAEEFSGARWRSLGTGPMWFVAILLAVTVGWTSWRWVRPAPADPPGQSLELGHLVLAAGLVAGGNFVVRLEFPIDSPQFLDAHVWFWPQAVVLFALGAVGAERGWMTSLPDALRRRCHQGALGVIPAVVLVVLLSPGPETAKGGWHWQVAALAACEGVFAVAMSVSVLDWFRRRLDRQGRRARQLAAGAYGAFVVQGPVLVLFALALRPLDVSGDLKFVVLASASVAACYALALGAIAVTRGRR
jgi:hypothetical protein